MSRVQDTVVGGGVGALSPFTAGRVTYISAADPPTIGAMSVAAFTLGTAGTHPALVISATPDTDPQPGASETLRVSGGAIIEGAAADTVCIGRTATTPSSGAIAIGLGAITAASNSVCVGRSATCTTGGVSIGFSADATGNNSCAVGANAQATVQNACAIGDGASSTGVNSLALGASAAASAAGAIAIGNGAIANAAGSCVIGAGATANAFKSLIVAGGVVSARADDQVWIMPGGNTPNTVGATGGCIVIGGTAGTTPAITHANVIIIGSGQSSIAANTMVLGGVGTPITQAVIGRGNTSTAAVAAGLTIRCTNGITTNNIAMGDLTVTAPLGTGNAASGSVLLQTGLIQAAGNTQHPARTGVAVNASATAADTDLLVFDVDTATLARVSVGAAGSGGGAFKLLRIPN